MHQLPLIFFFWNGEWDWGKPNEKALEEGCPKKSEIKGERRGGSSQIIFVLRERYVTKTGKLGWGGGGSNNLKMILPQVPPASPTQGCL